MNYQFTMNYHELIKFVGICYVDGKKIVRSERPGCRLALEFSTSIEYISYIYIMDDRKFYQKALGDNEINLHCESRTYILHKLFSALYEVIDGA